MPHAGCHHVRHCAPLGCWMATRRPGARRTVSVWRAGRGRRSGQVVRDGDRRRGHCGPCRGCRRGCGCCAVERRRLVEHKRRPRLRKRQFVDRGGGVAQERMLAQ
eukprot:363042-Chlamydomonas_euryale.AAC.5